MRIVSRTMATERSVLAVVHTITALNRFADILSVFDSDRRVQVVYTCPYASAVTNGVEEHLTASGALAMPWEQAIVTEFDLAVSVHNSGNLHELNAPLAIMSHGIGYTKVRKPETGNQGAYGLSRESLIRDGSVAPRAIVLSHEEQYARLADTVPEALDAAVVAGDPCLDRMMVSEPRRRHYRAVLGATDSTRVVLVTSTWGPDSLLGRRPDLIAQLLAELPSDQHVVAAVLHPNAWFAHGPAQIRLWLGDCLRAGLRLIPPAEGWQQAVLAADVVIGDFGAVTAYSACLDRATLLASFPDDQVAPGSAVAALGRTARRLDPAAPFTEQFDAATNRFAEVRELATSLPGGSASALRKLFYDIMAFPEPARTPLVPAYSPAALAPERVPVAAWWATADWHSEREVRVTRWPADVDARPEQPPNVVDRHLVVDRCHSRRDLYTNAAIVLLEHASEAAAVFAERPACVLVVAANQILHRDGTVIALDKSNVDDVAAVAVARHGHAIPDQFTVLVGSRRLHVTAR